MGMITYADDYYKNLDLDFCRYPIWSVRSGTTLMIASQSEFRKAKAYMDLPKRNMNEAEREEFFKKHAAKISYVQSEVQKELQRIKAKGLKPPRVRKVQEAKVFKQDPLISVPQMVRYLRKNCHPTQWESEKTIRKNRFGDGPNQMPNASACKVKKVARFSDFLKCFSIE